MGRRPDTYRRGVATTVGAIIAIAAMIALAVIVTQALDERARLAEERLERAREDLAVIPVVNSTGVYAEIINRGYVDTLIKYIIVINRSNGQIIYNAAPSTHLDPGNTTLVKLGDWSHGRLDIAVVTQRGSVFRWDPELTLDGVLDLPGEPSRQTDQFTDLINNYLLDYLGVDCTNIIKINVSMDAARYSIKVTASTNSPTGYNYYYVIDFYIDRRLVERIEYRGVTAIPPNSRVFQYFKVINNTYIYGKVEYRSGSLVLAAEAGLYINNTIFVANKRSSIYGLEPILNVNVYGIYLYENYYPVTQDVHEIPADYNLRNYGTVAVEVPVHAEALVCS